MKSSKEILAKMIGKSIGNQRNFSSWQEAPHLVQSDVSDWLGPEADDLHVLFERDMRQDPQRQPLPERGSL